MNRDDAKSIVDRIELIKAYAEGAEIQYFDGDVWREAGQPCFDSRIKYRVKGTPREFWVNIYPSGQEGVLHKSKEAASTAIHQAQHNIGVETLHLREVLDEE